MLLDGDAGKLPKEATGIIEDINENSQRLISLVNDLLNVSPINQGRSLQSPQPVGVTETILAALKNQKGYADKNKVKVIFNKEKSPDRQVMIIPRRFSESVGNVVSNSIKYAPPNSMVKISVLEKD